MKFHRFVVVATALLSLQLAAAQAQSKKPTLSVPPPIPAKATPKLSKLKGGTVVSVNAAAGMVTIQAKDGTQASYTVTKATRLHRNRKPAKLSDIAAGDHVMLARFNGATKEAAQLELFANSGGKAIPAAGVVPSK